MQTGCGYRRKLENPEFGTVFPREVPWFLRYPNVLVAQGRIGGRKLPREKKQIDSSTGFYTGSWQTEGQTSVWYDIYDTIRYDTMNYTVSQKTRHWTLAHNFPQMLADFQNSFADILSGKLATNSHLNIPPHRVSLHYLVKYLRSKNLHD